MAMSRATRGDHPIKLVRCSRLALGDALHLGSMRVATDEGRRAALAHQPGQDLDYPRPADRACNVNRQALAGEFVDDRQALDLLAVGASVEHEVVLTCSQILGPLIPGGRPFLGFRTGSDAAG